MEDIIPIPKKLSKKLQKELSLLKLEHPNKCFCSIEYEKHWRHYQILDSHFVRMEGTSSVYSCVVCGKEWIAGETAD